MGIGAYLAAVGCLSSAATFQLYQAKVSECENLAIELNDKLKEINQALVSKGEELDRVTQESEEYIVVNEKSYKEEITSLRTRVREVEKCCEVLEKELDGARKENSVLKEEVEKFRARVAQLDGDLSKTAREREQMKEEYQFKINNEIERLIASKDLEISSLKQVVLSLKEEKESSSKLYSQLVDKSNKQYFDFETEVSKLSETIKELNGSINEKGIQLSNKEKEVDVVTTKFQFQSNEIKQLTNKLAEKTSELTKHSEELIKQNNKVSELEEIIKGKDHGFDLLKNKLKDESDSYKQKIDELETSLKNQLRELTGTKETLNNLLFLKDEISKFANELKITDEKSEGSISTVEEESEDANEFGSRESSDETRSASKDQAVNDSKVPYSEEEGYEVVKHEEGLASSSEEFDELDVDKENSKPSSHSEHGKPSTSAENKANDKQGESSSTDLKDTTDYFFEVHYIKKIKDYINTLSQNMVKHENDSFTKNTHIDELNDKILQYQKQLETKDSTIRSLSKDLDEKLKFIENDEARVKNLETKLKESSEDKSTVAELSGKLSEKEQLINKLSEQIKDYEDEIKEHESKDEEFTSLLLSKDSTIQSLSKELKEIKELTISSLTNEVQQHKEKLFTINKKLQEYESNSHTQSTTDPLSSDREKSYKEKISLLEEELKKSKQDIEKHRSILSKNFDILREYKSRSPSPSPTKSR